MSCSLLDDLQCPHDDGPLHRDEAGGRYSCERCARSYPIEQGVVRFLEDRDDFYEGRYLHTIRFLPATESLATVWPIWLINSGYVWEVRRQVPAGAALLEIGCASGVAYFAHRYRVLGLDLSFSSLARIATLYQGCLQADFCRGIPLPDASIDAVASSYVWEHVPPSEKPAALRELRRVLKPGGKLIFLYDVESRNPLYRAMRRRNPALYREILIDREGHLGWQTPEENRRLFEQHGFRTLLQAGKEKLLISPAMYDKVGNWGGWLGAISRVGVRFCGSPQYYFYNGVLRGLDETLGRLLPTAWSRVLLTVCQRG